MAEAIEARIEEGDEYLLPDRSNNRMRVSCSCPRFVFTDGVIKLSHREGCEVRHPEEKRTGPLGHDVPVSANMEGHSFGSGR